MREKNRIIRKTKSVCPVCMTKIEADVIERDSKVFLEKTCNEHGAFSLLLSQHPEYYRGLNDYYFSLMSESLPQRDYILHLTNACNLNCPICLADANQKERKDYPLDDLKGFLKGKKNYKIDLMGAEPTMREDLPEIIDEINRSGNIAALHTNGIKLADSQYLQQLMKSGLHEVHLQFDGFNDDVYEKIRGKKQLALKIKALENLERLHVATDLVATIIRGINEQEMVKILDYGARKDFIKEIFFLGCRFLGGAKNLPIENCVMPDELIDLLEEQTQGKILRENVYRFQKLYFALLSAFSKRKCFYIHHYIIFRNKNGFVPLDQIMNLKGIDDSLEKFKNMRIKGNVLAVPYLLACLIFRFVGFRALSLLKEGLFFILLFIKGFNLSKLPKKGVLLGFITACDGYSLDYQIARNCGKGAISVERGVEDCGAFDNVSRDNFDAELSR
ncbi:MAG: radical SAM protein [Candidatus Omnitrophica bacterium]|nr:radical SAM protein [Candidatus Omnitrophota bacterium]